MTTFKAKQKNQLKNNFKDIAKFLVKLANDYLIKIILSLIISFQLLAIFVLPNPESVLYRKLSWAIEDYGNFLGINTTWRFFSPNPLVRRIEYQVFSRAKNGELVGKKYLYPNLVAQEKSRETHNRKFAHGLIMYINPMLLKKTFGPYLCRLHPEAETIAVNAKGREFSSLEKSIFEGEKREEIGRAVEVSLSEFECADGKML
jgi:hypothetical protein